MKNVYITLLALCIVALASGCKTLDIDRLLDIVTGDEPEVVEPAPEPEPDPVVEPEPVEEPEPEPEPEELSKAIVYVRGNKTKFHAGPKYNGQTIYLVDTPAVVNGYTAIFERVAKKRDIITMGDTKMQVWVIRSY
jgi:hypothetical protein